MPEQGAGRVRRSSKSEVGTSSPLQGKLGKVKESISRKKIFRCYLILLFGKSMENKFEIELRYEVLDQIQMISFLAQAERLGTSHDVDIYLDRPDRILWKRGIFIRVRNDKKLDIKFNRVCLEDPSIDRLDYCEEHSFSLPLQAQHLTELNTLLKSLDLKVIADADFNLLKSVNQLDLHYVVDKVRISYRLGDFTLTLDEVKDLGTFIEIELMAQSAEVFEKVKDEMKGVLAGLKLKPLRLGYCSQILKKYQFACYRQGRYVLQEDIK